MQLHRAEVKLGGKHIAILEEAGNTDFEGGSLVFGRYFPESNIVKFRSGQPPEQVRDTVLHELIHAMDYHGQLRMKERQVHVLASLMCELMWENPEFVDWMMAR